MLHSSLKKVLARPQPGSEGPVSFTLIICAIAVVVMVGINAESAHPSWDQMARWGYLSAERVWDGAFWALISSAFVHVALWHLAFNVYWMWHLGGAVERELGSVQYLCLVIVLAFVSSAFQLAVSGDTGIGASGVVYGLFGLMWRSRERVPRFAAVLGSETPTLFFVWLVGCMVATYAGFANIGNAAHVGGLLLGVLVAEWRTQGPYRRLAGSSAVLLCALGLLATFANPWSGRWLEYHAMKMHRARQYENAAVTYERSLSFGADSAWAYYNLALVYYSMGDSAGCADALKNLRATSPAEADSLEPRLLGSKFFRAANK